ncbi:hypothetical protein [Anabaena sp. CCY 9910]|uniref:hypothetical protein n=1 Tax=Anabaena sp. CCY 9910 TaxID=3103870 RepID=UPI0039DF8E97
MSIQNRNFFTDVNFLPEHKFKLIGEFAGKKLLLIGRTNAYGDPIVAASHSNEPSQEDLYAYDLYELMKCNQELVNITGEI